MLIIKIVVFSCPHVDKFCFWLRRLGVGVFNKLTVPTTTATIKLLFNKLIRIWLAVDK